MHFLDLFRAFKRDTKTDPPQNNFIQYEDQTSIYLTSRSSLVTDARCFSAVLVVTLKRTAKKGTGHRKSLPMLNYI
jgi:hypothetical protein